MKKIIHVISDTNMGGAGTHLLNLLSCIDREKFDCSVILPQGSALAPRVAQLNILVMEIRHGADRSLDLSAIPEVTAHIRRQHPHIVHTHGALYGRLAAALCRVPVVVSTRHCADSRQKRAFPPAHLARRWADSLSNHHTIATADYVRDILIQRGCDPRRITVIHNGSIPPAPLSAREESILRAELGIKQGVLAVGMVARLAEGKGQEVFLRAARVCALQNPDIRFFIIGSGPREAELKTLAAHLGLIGIVRFLGFRADVPRLMHVLNLNVNCSQFSETSSLSLSEGMAAGAVPVVSNCGGNPFMAGFGQNGMVFPIDDHHKLAKAILTLAEDPSRLASLSLACQARFSDQFTAKRMTEQTEALYLRLAK